MLIIFFTRSPKIMLILGLLVRCCLLAVSGTNPGPREKHSGVSCIRRKDKKYAASSLSALNGRPTAMCSYFELILSSSVKIQREILSYGSENHTFQQIRDRRRNEKRNKGLVHTLFENNTLSIFCVGGTEISTLLVLS